MSHFHLRKCFYASLGGKPCMVEKIGTLGRNMCRDDIFSGFMRVNLYSNWANSVGGPQILEGGGFTKYKKMHQILANLKYICNLGVFHEKTP